MLLPKNLLKSCFGLLIILGSIPSMAQTVNSVTAKIDQNNTNNVIITYNLVESAPNQEYRIEVRSSWNQFSKPLELVSGHVGDNVRPGNGKSITWRAREEIGLYVGNLTFEVQATLVSSPWRLISPRLSDEFNPGNSLPIEWEGGFQNSTVKIQLFKSDALLRDITTTPLPNTIKKHNWQVPENILDGTDYKIRLFDPVAPADAVMSDNFALKVNAAAAQTKPAKEKKEKKGGGKAGWIIGGLAVAGGAAYFLLSGGEEDDPQQQPQTPIDTFEIPSPPGTPDGTTIRKKPGIINWSLSF